jgi:hypothetical protein
MRAQELSNISQHQYVAQIAEDVAKAYTASFATADRLRTAIASLTNSMSAAITAAQQRHPKPIEMIASVSNLHPDAVAFRELPSDARGRSGLLAG